MLNMRKTVMICCLLLSVAGCLAQPGWVKNASKSVFTLKTFSADGSLIASSNGFFTGASGEAVSNFTPFKGATRAVIIDFQGKELPVVSILGANDMYDVVKFRVKGKTQPMNISTSTASEGSNVWLLPYHEVKNVMKGVVRKAEKFHQNYDYYTVAITMPENSVSCPLLNDAGEVIGMMQQPASVKDTLNYAVGASFADSLKISGFSMNDATLKLTQIKKELPDDITEATLALYLANSQADSITYATMVNDFLEKFPNAADGYSYRAQLLAGNGDFAAAQQDMEQAIKLAEKKEEAHFSYAHLIYNKEVYQSAQPYSNWSLDKALTEVREAIGINSQPTYRQLEAAILFAQQKYDESYNIYHELTDSELRSAEIFYAAARCKEMLKDTTAMLALMDSTMNTFSKPYLKEAAPYLWARAQAKLNTGKYRDAITDMNEYENLMKATIDDNFYYVRHQAEIKGRLYQQALNDINRAVQMNPQEILYYAEKASLEVRVGMYDQAMQTAQECIQIDPNNSDGYLFLGLAQCLKGQKADGIANLQKARDLGDAQAEGLIEKYK
jgi:tetratricopeptide (TPR) repeat protein